VRLGARGTLRDLVGGCHIFNQSWEESESRKRDVLRRKGCLNHGVNCGAESR
jgi:hypothetical protein